MFDFKLCPRDTEPTFPPCCPICGKELTPNKFQRNFWCDDGHFTFLSVPLRYFVAIDDLTFEYDTYCTNGPVPGDGSEEPYIMVRLTDDKSIHLDSLRNICKRTFINFSDFYNYCFSIKPTLIFKLQDKTYE